MENIVDFNESKLLEYMESDDAFEYLYGSDPDCLFIDVASMRSSKPIYISTLSEANEVIYHSPHGLYENYIKKALDNFYNGIPQDNGFKHLDINSVIEYMGSKPLLICRDKGYHYGIWEYRK